MPERVDVNTLDYMFGLDATVQQKGIWIPMLGYWGWSCTLVQQGGANGTLVFQATDFDPKGNNQFPFNTLETISGDALQITASGGVCGRMGKAYDPVWNTAKWLRAVWNNNTSSAGSKIYVAFTFRRN